MTFPYLNETQAITDAVRSQAGGSFIRLLDGITHYELSNSAASSSTERPTVVLIPGFSAPYFVWDPTFEFLTKSGYRVLRYDLFGRGYSDRPHIPYDLNLFVRQLRGLLDGVNTYHPVTVVGLSMGGAIATTFACRFPHRVNKVVLIDSSGAKPAKLTPLMRTIYIPMLAELIFGFASEERILKGQAASFFAPTLIEKFIDRYRPQMQYKGFKRALISSLREGMLGDFTPGFHRLGTLNKPTMLIWGRNDTTIPVAHAEIIRSYIPHAELHIIENAGHVPHYEQPDEVNSLLLQFLRASEHSMTDDVERWR